MRVLVMGAGAVGGYYGGVLALHGHGVTFVARGPHLAAMRDRGLELRTDGQVRLLPTVAAVASPAEATGPIDLVLFTVKGYDTEAAAEALRPAVGLETAVLTLQNGVDSVDKLSAALGPRPVLAGATYVVATLVAPGVIAQTGPSARVVLGEPAGPVTPRVEAITAALRQAGVDATAIPDGLLAVWQKFVGLAAHASITSVCRAPVGAIRAAPEGPALYRRAIAEAAAVARASGVALPDGTEERVMGIFTSLPETANTSLQVDFESGNRVELEQLTGAVVRRARAAGVPTPTFDTLYDLLRIRVSTDGIPT